MSARHLLSCQCGATIPVAASQAGGSAVCAECGATQSIPRLGQLRELPLETVSTNASGGWGFRQGLLTAGLLLSAALAAGAAWFAANEPAPPQEFNANSRAEMIDADLELMSPRDLWGLFTFRYQPMITNGMQRFENPQERAIRSAITRSQLFRDGLLYAAGGVLAAALGAFALLPKSS